MQSEMSYKEIIRSQGSIVAKYRVLRATRKRSYKETAIHYGMHRNSVSNIVKTYDENKTSEIESLLAGSHLSIEEIEKSFSFLEHTSRKPHTYRGTAPPNIEKIVTDEFKVLGYGYRRMLKHLQKKEKISENIKEGIFKGIYKRNGFKVKKKRTKNGERTPLYNYKAISPFEYLHYDVKHILDQGALPQDIYTKFELTKGLPIYQRTIIDAATRWRFLAYSHKINSTFGFQFLLFTLMFIRNQRIDRHITIGFDGGAEFCKGSENKLAKRNSLLKEIDCESYQYDGSRDIRKNLIERSHRSDDEEFYVPRGTYINSLEDFKKESKDWYMHRNYTRIHTGTNMSCTPYDKLVSKGVWKKKGRDKFPVLILDDCISDLMYYTKTIPTKRSLIVLP